MLRPRDGLPFQGSNQFQAYHAERRKQVENSSNCKLSVFAFAFRPFAAIIGMLEIEMERTTDAERDAYVAEAAAKYPDLDTFAATLKLAMDEAEAAWNLS